MSLFSKPVDLPSGRARPDGSKRPLHRADGPSHDALKLIGGHGRLRSQRVARRARLSSALAQPAAARLRHRRTSRLCGLRASHEGLAHRGLHSNVTLRDYISLVLEVERREPLRIVKAGATGKFGRCDPEALRSG